jgi:hypothetical protein
MEHTLCSKDVRYSGLSSRLLTVFAEFPTILIRFCTSVYSGSVFELAFSEPDPISTKKKYRNKRRNEVFPSVFITNQSQHPPSHSTHLLDLHTVNRNRHKHQLPGLWKTTNAWRNHERHPGCMISPFARHDVALSDAPHLSMPEPGPQTTCWLLPVCHSPQHLC